MRRRNRLLTALILAVLLSITSVCATAEDARDKAMDSLFAGGGALRLEEISLNPGSLDETAALLDLSPDGKTGIWTYQVEGSPALAVVREDGTAIPVRIEPLPEIGDPFNKAKLILSSFMGGRIQGREGISWSEDGRYACFSDYNMFIQGRSLDIPVLDTETGAVYLADTYNSKLSEADGGIVVVSRISRSGDSIVYLLMASAEDGRHYRLCRCSPQGGSREILADILCDEQAPFDIISIPYLREEADGSWLLTGLNGYERGKDGKRPFLSEIRFVPAESGWTVEPHSLRILMSFRFDLAPRSARSQYGLYTLTMPNTDVANAAMEYSSDLTTTLYSSLKSYINLVRVHPGEDFRSDIWYMTETENGAEMRPADDYLWSLKVRAGMLEDDEMEKAEQWLKAIAERVAPEEVSLMDLLPEGYDKDAMLQAMGYKMTVNCVCLSPDGYYALVSARKRSDMTVGLYLVNLETMQVRPVEGPEDISETQLADITLSMTRQPGMTWNEDGTILIYRYGRNAGAKAYRITAE